VNLVDAGMVLVLGQDAGVLFRPSSGFRMSSGCRQDVVRMRQDASGDRSGVRVRVRSSPG